MFFFARQKRPTMGNEQSAPTPRTTRAAASRKAHRPPPPAKPTTTDAVCAALLGIEPKPGACGSGELRRAAEFYLEAATTTRQAAPAALWPAAVMGQVFNALRAVGKTDAPHSDTGSGMRAWMAALRARPGSVGAFVSVQGAQTVVGLQVLSRGGELEWGPLPAVLPVWCAEPLQAAIRSRYWTGDYTAVCSFVPGGFGPAVSALSTHHEGLLASVLGNHDSGADVAVTVDATRVVVLNRGALPEGQRDLVATLFGPPPPADDRAQKERARAAFRVTPMPLAKRDATEVTVEVGGVGFVALRFVLSDSTTYTGVGRELPSVVVQLPADTPLTASLGLSPNRRTAHRIAGALRRAVERAQAEGAVFAPLAAQLAARALAGAMGDEGGPLTALANAVAEAPGAVPSRFWAPLWSRFAACVGGTVRLFPVDAPLCARGVVAALLDAHPGLRAPAGMAGAVRNGTPVALGGAFPGADVPNDWAASAAGTEANAPGVAPLLFMPNRMLDEERFAELPDEWVGAVQILFQRYGVLPAGAPPAPHAPPEAWAMIEANTGERRIFTTKDAVVLARYFVAPAPDKLRALRALARGIAKRRRTSVFVYGRNRKDTLVPMGFAAPPDVRRPVTPTEAGLAEFFVDYTERTGTLIAYARDWEDDARAAGEGVHPVDLFVAHVLATPPVPGLRVHADYAVDVLLSGTDATADVLGVAAPALRLGEAVPLTDLPELGFTHDLAVPRPRFVARMLDVVAQARCPLAWFAADAFARHCRPTAVTALGSTPDGMAWFAFETAAGDRLAGMLRRHELFPGALAPAATAAECAALFADMADGASVVRGVGAVDAQHRLGVAVTRTGAGLLQVASHPDAATGGQWGAAFCVAPEDAPVFANKAARLCAANRAVEAAAHSHADTGTPLGLLGTDGGRPAESFAFAAAPDGGRAALLPLTALLDRWPENRAMPWIQSAVKRGASVALDDDGALPQVWTEVDVCRWLVLAMLAFPVLATEFFPDFRSNNPVDQVASFTASDAPSLHRTLFRTRNAGLIRTRSPAAPVPLTIAELARFAVQGTLAAHFEGPAVELLTLAYAPHTEPGGTCYARSRDSLAGRLALQAWAVHTAQAMGVRGLRFVVTGTTSVYNFEPATRTVHLTACAALEFAVSIAAVAWPLHLASSPAAFMWGEEGVLWHELRHAADYTEHPTAPVPDNTMHTHTPLEYAGGHRLYAYDDRVGLVARTALWADVPDGDGGAAQVPMWYKLARGLKRLAGIWDSEGDDGPDGKRERRETSPEV